MRFAEPPVAKTIFVSVPTTPPHTGSPHPAPWILMFLFVIPKCAALPVPQVNVPVGRTMVSPLAAEFTLFWQSVNEPSHLKVVPWHGAPHQSIPTAMADKKNLLIRTSSFSTLDPHPNVSVRSAHLDEAPTSMKRLDPLFTR